MAIIPIFLTIGLQSSDDKVEYIINSFDSHYNEFIIKSEMKGDSIMGIRHLSKKVGNITYILNMEYVTEHRIAVTSSKQIDRNEWIEIFTEELRFNFNNKDYEHRIFHFSYEKESEAVKKFKDKQEVWDEVIRVLFSNRI